MENIRGLSIRLFCGCTEQPWISNDATNSFNPMPDEPEPNRGSWEFWQQKSLGWASKSGRSTDSSPLHIFLRMQLYLMKPVWFQAISAVLY